ncbi:MAG: fluoride efflux transporter CrcB [Pseudomonadota bacterium]
MTLYAIVAVFVGAGLGACLRYALNLALNPLFPHMPLGTLAANLIGGYLVGAAAAYFLLRTQLPPEYRLLVITGFLGGLTTFSAFSLEVVNLLQGDRPAMALLTVAAHVLGSLALTALGALSVRAALT